MDESLEELGLAPDLTPLPSEVRDLIHHGSPNGYPDDSEPAVAVCAALFRTGYGVDEVWMVLTNPSHGISEEFFSQDGEQAEAWLEEVVSETYEAFNRSECDD